MELVRYAVVRYGDIYNGGAVVASEMVLTNDCFWQTRGHYSLNPQRDRHLVRAHVGRHHFSTSLLQAAHSQLAVCGV